MAKRSSLVTSKLATLPKTPGVYVFRNDKGNVLYVGKAKNLANRVRSYFQKNASLEEHKQIMVQEVADIETTAVPSEKDAILLEATFIKEYRPPYNIILKDDKSFLYIRITTSEEYPTVDTVRRITNKRDTYIGPFISAAACRDTVRMLKRIFRFRTCEPNSGKPCFDYTIKRCLGVCIGAIDKEGYGNMINQLIQFLKGNTETVVNILETEMKRAAQRHAFEYAALIRDRMRALVAVMQKQVVISPDQSSFDVLGLHRESHLAAVVVMWVRKGRLMQKQSFVLSHTQQESEGAIMRAFVEQYYVQVIDRPSIAYATHLPDERTALQQTLGVRFVSAQRGRKRALQKSADENAQQALTYHLASFEKDELKRHRILDDIAKRLSLPRRPVRIEAYDVANISGVHATGSMVVFIDGKPAKKFYKRFAIKSVHQANDPAMLAEIIKRRMAHLHGGETGWELPDLILLDGGKGQLSVVRKAMLGTDVSIPLVAISKSGHDKPTQQSDRERFFLLNGSEIKISRSDTLYLIERIRDESHRFATSYYQKKHGASATSSSLDQIPGIGPKTKKLLIRSFGSLQGIKRAKEKDVAAIVGKKAARQIRERI